LFIVTAKADDFRLFIVMAKSMNHVDKLKSPKMGLRVRSLPRGGFLSMSGLRPGDRIISVNGQDIVDELDFYYHAAQDFLDVEIERGGRAGVIEAERPPGVPLEIDFYEKPVGRCANRCVFCFVDQQPKGLRRSLYIKDEDFRYSFLNGNYMTLTSASREDLRRAASIGLSPLFVSVHATDREVRAAMLGNGRIPDIRAQLSYLRDNGIAFHTQIVLCPGMNDGAVLDRTIEDLFGYGRALLSIAVVPVGLTRFRKKPLVPVGRACAVEVCGRLGAVSDRMKRADGVRKLFAADEFFIRAGLPIPPVSYYEDYPQIENGVGLVRQLLHEGAKIKRRLRGTSVDNSNRKRKNILLITGQSAFPFLKKVFDDIAPFVNKNFDVKPVDNHYFGETVTVAGLLSAKDVIKKIKNLSGESSYTYNEVILPGAMFNHAGYTLDGYSPSRVGKSVNLSVKAAGTIGEVIGAK
jgi:putative radical SAM enzyme (TIGR03279 family)